MRSSTNLNAEVGSEILPDKLPYEDITVDVVKSLVFAVIMGGGPYGEICQTWGIGVVIDGFPEIFVSREVRGLVELAADQHVDGDS